MNIVRVGVDALQTRGILRVVTMRYGCIVLLCGVLVWYGRSRMFEDVLCLEEDDLGCRLGWKCVDLVESVLRGCFLEIKTSQVGGDWNIYTPADHVEKILDNTGMLSHLVYNLKAC